MSKAVDIAAEELLLLAEEGAGLLALHFSYFLPLCFLATPFRMASFFIIATPALFVFFSFFTNF